MVDKRIVYPPRRRRRRFNRKGGGKLARLAKIVNRTKPTNKVYESIIAGYISNNGLTGVAGNATQVFLPSTGVGFYARQSPTVHLNKIQMSGFLSTADSSTVTRVMMYTGPDAQLPLDNHLFNRGTTVAVCQPPTPSNLCDQKYKILYDSGPMPMGTSGGLWARKAFKKTLNLKGHKIDFADLSSSTPVQNGIWFTALSQDIDGVVTDSSVGATFQCFYSG